MTLTAIILLLISAFTHAGWNLLGKREYPATTFFLVANIVGCLCFTPVLILYAHTLALVPIRVWMFITLTGLCQAIYYTALAGAYRTGDLSVAYPLARSSPVIVVMIVTLVLGRGNQVSTQCVLGIVLVVGGCFLLPMRRFTDFRLSNYLNVSCLSALVAAFGTSGYSIIDDEALRHLRQTPGMPANVSIVTLIYVFFEALSSSLWLFLFILLSGQERISLRIILRTRMRTAGLTGLGIYLTYTLVLISMAFVSNVSYVVAFRQLSVLLGAVLGVFVLHEPRCIPKFIGVSVMFVGVVLVGTG